MAMPEDAATGLSTRAWRGLAQLVVVLMLCLFLPAWSLRFWQAWVYLALFVGSCVAITRYLMRHDVRLLERRLAAGPRAEKESRQQVIQLVASVAFLGMFVAPGFDHRFGWSTVPLTLVLLGDLLVVSGFWIVFRTFRENSYTSATIETAEGQQVVSTGPYAVVRHPMYAGALLMLLGTPLALGSLWALAGFAAMVVVIVWRLMDEERVLSRDLPGYAAYLSRVRYRLVPFVW
jgi:protein-S-isoprenylcysteine O-methyltransferase Ste14